MQTGSCTRDPLDLIHVFRSFPGNVFATFIIINKMILEVRLCIHDEGKMRKKEEREHLCLWPQYRRSAIFNRVTSL